MSDTSKSTRYVRHNIANTTNYYSYLHDDSDATPSAFLSVHNYPDETRQTIFRSKHANFTSKPLIEDEGYFRNRPEDYGAEPWHESGLIDDPNYIATGRQARENEQLQLFSHTPPRPSQVSMLLSQEGTGAKVSAMTLIGMADIDARRKTGQSLKPSEDLSRHSLRIVRHLNSVGAISDDDVPSRSTNSYNFTDANEQLRTRPSYGAIAPVAQGSRDVEDVTHLASRAKRHITKIMRPDRETPKAEPEKSEQLSMPLEGWDSK